MTLQKPKNDDDNERFRKSFYQAYGIYGGMGFQLAVAVTLGALGGKYLDEKLATAPLFLIGGVILGTFAGFFSLYRVLQNQKEKKKKNDDNSSKS